MQNRAHEIMRPILRNQLLDSNLSATLSGEEIFKPASDRLRLLVRTQY